MTVTSTGVLGLVCTATGFSVLHHDDDRYTVDAVLLPWTDTVQGDGSGATQLLVLQRSADDSSTATWMLRILSIPGTVFIESIA